MAWSLLASGVDAGVNSATVSGLAWVSNGVGGTQVTSAVSGAAMDNQLATDWDVLSGV